MAVPGRKQNKGKRPSHGACEVAVDTSKPTAVFKPGKARMHTLSVAIPGSIIANCQTHDQKTTLAGQIARALAVFCVDEIIIFHDDHSAPLTPSRSQNGHQQASHSPDRPSIAGYAGDADPAYFLAHVLTYLETPPHLRRALFPMHPNLRTAGALPSLDVPHHLRAHEWCRYREGVTVRQPLPGGRQQQQQNEPLGAPPAQKKRKQEAEEDAATTVFVDVGLPHPVIVPTPLALHSRVTVRLDADAPAEHALQHRPPRNDAKHFPSATPVSPTLPREDGGYYWGYAVRAAASLTAVFTESPYDGGYDVSVGTSERGIPLGSMAKELPEVHKALKTYAHLLLVIGGVAGLERAVAVDEELRARGVPPSEAGQCFDAWVNLCPGQGSRTIRAEEALWIGLMGLKPYVDARAA